MLTADHALAIFCFIAVIACALSLRAQAQAITYDNERASDIVNAVQHCACEYAEALAMDYSARDARAHVRAYIHYQYPQYDGDTARAILRDAIYQGLCINHTQKHGAVMQEMNEAIEQQ